MSTNWLTPANDPMTSALLSLQSRRGSLANAAIGAGTTYLQQQKYDLALRSFQQATAYQPDSPDAHVLMARTYTFMGRTEEAIASYQKALRADPAYTDARMELGKLYLKSGRFEEAEKEFGRTLASAPGTAEAVRALGYIALEGGRLEEAANRFDQAIRMSPKDANAYFGLGRVRVQQNDTGSAIEQFERALEMNRGYAEAYSELAYVYLGQGRTDLARDQVDALQGLRTAESLALADQLDLAMFTPKFSYMDPAHSTFRLLGLPGTPVASLSPSLAAPGGSAMLAVSFVFNQPMSVGSVQNIFNWSITKANGGVGGVYNNGANLHPENEANILPFPVSVQYDAENRRATVYFRITQNSTGDAVIDPNHWVFQFRGTDAGGKPMDPLGDQYDGWASRKY